MPVALILRLDDLTLDDLTALFDRALDASSLDEIDAAIDEMLTDESKSAKD